MCFTFRGLFHRTIKKEVYERHNERNENLHLLLRLQQATFILGVLFVLALFCWKPAKKRNQSNELDQDEDAIDSEQDIYKNQQ